MGGPDVTEQRTSPGGAGVTLRLLWPQWQGAGTPSVRELAPEFPFDVARRGYAVGSEVLGAILPAGDGPTAAAPVAMDDTGLELRDGIEAKDVIVAQLAAAFEVIRAHDRAGSFTAHPAGALRLRDGNVPWSGGHLRLVLGVYSPLSIAAMPPVSLVGLSWATLRTGGPLG
jgi:hypothetical protein